MKVKACPSIETVRGILQERIDQEREYLVGQKSKLDELTSNKSSLYSPGRETETKLVRAAIILGSDTLRARETEMVLLQSHTAPRVLVEIEV